MSGQWCGVRSLSPVCLEDESSLGVLHVCTVSGVLDKSLSLLCQTLVFSEMLWDSNDA